jgi:hypothetical protein
VVQSLGGTSPVNITGNGTATPTVSLSVGAAGTVLSSNGTTDSWATVTPVLVTATSVTVSSNNQYVVITYAGDTGSGPTLTLPDATSTYAGWVVHILSGSASFSVHCATTGALLDGTGQIDTAAYGFGSAGTTFSYNNVNASGTLQAVFVCVCDGAHWYID